MGERILDGLNDAQRSAVIAVRGPLCILAGAGTGKTTTITRRIAYQVEAGAFPSGRILAVTFTDRAAGEMRKRLVALGGSGGEPPIHGHGRGHTDSGGPPERMGVGDLRARTFHAEALAQVAHFSGSPALLDSKALLISSLVRRLPPPFKFRATRDVAGEIERAKNRRVPPARYEAELGDHTPPLPPDVMARVYREYESRKRRMGRIDFEDLLEDAIRLLEENAEAAERIRARYHAFTVDEYQDVNLLQQSLLDLWLGPREELCVVGDDYQSIFGFTGATPDYLLGFQRRFPSARVVTLEQNYRSTPEVLEVANRLVPAMQGSAKVLRSVRPSGPQPVLAEHASGAEETERIARDVRELIGKGVAAEGIAILYRINARSEDYEEALSLAGIPFQVRDGAFLRRPGPRAVITRLRRAERAAPAAEATERAALDAGWEPGASAETTEEITRQADLTRLVRLAAEFGRTVEEFLADLRSRFENESEGRGVVLSTYHRAKGLEFEAVFLPRLEERELPFALARSDEDQAEERRLLYVGITRARRHLTITWARSRDGKTTRPSRFVLELMPRTERPVRAMHPPAAPADPELFSRLRKWRTAEAARAGMPPYCVFHDATLRAICEKRPASLVELGRVSGIGPQKLARWGADVLELVKES